MTDTVVANPVAVAEPLLAQMVKKYIELRDRKKLLKDQFTKDTEAIDAGMARAEAYFMQQMQKQGLESLPTEFGVPYQSRRTSCSVSDGEAFFAFLQDSGRWELLDKRASKAAVEAYKEETSDLPPGLNWNSEVVINVRRK